MRAWIHNPKFVAVIVAVTAGGIILAGVFLLSGREEDVQERPHTFLENREASEFESADDSFLDADADGLLGWEENLWGTDVHNPDSDGDGTPDGDEVRNGRDPTIAPPDTRIPAVPDEAADAFIPTTPFHFNAGQNGSAMEPSGAVSEPKPANPLKQYGNDLGGTLTTHLANISWEESRVFGAIIDGPNDRDFADLEEIAALYAALSNAMDSMEIPSEAADVHGALQTGYKNQSDAVVKLASYRRELAVPASAFAPYNETVKEAGKRLIAVADFFRDQGVSFSAHEPGSIFVIPGR